MDKTVFEVRSFNSVPSGTIAVILPDLRSGGAERNAVILIKEFVKRRFQVHLLLGEVAGNLLLEVPNSVRIVDLKATRLRAMVPALVRYLRGNRPDAMLPIMQEMNCISVIARGISGVSCRLILNERSHPSMHIRALPNRRGRAFMATLVRLCYRRSDGVIAVSNGVASDLRKNFGLNDFPVHVIHNPVDLERVSSNARELKNSCRQDNTKIPVLIAVGSLKPAKDFATLLRAFAILRKERNCRLMIIGEGSERDALERLAMRLCINDDVELPGYAENPWALMNMASVFVSSSVWEGFPNVILEALALGLPVVATDCPSGPAESLENGKYGWLVPVGDWEALAKALGQALEARHDKAASIRRAASFAPNIAAQKYLEFLFPE